MGILKTKPLTQLLSQSISPSVSSALLFTPSGSLLATGTSPNAPDAKRARTHAALAANIWSQYDRVAATGGIDSSTALDDNNGSDPGLKSLTVELSEYNLHIQLVAHRVLLCLIGPKHAVSGGAGSGRSSMHSEGGGSPQGSVPSGSGGTRTPPGTHGEVGVAAGGLGVLKTQAHGLVQYLERELRGFELPEGL